jgi:hypothetical protein
MERGTGGEVKKTDGFSRRSLEKEKISSFETPAKTKHKGIFIINRQIQIFFDIILYLAINT